jgi:hypothetical protein
MCQGHPPRLAMHAEAISTESVRGCIGHLEEAVGRERAESDAGLKPCFDYLRKVSDHFKEHAHQPSRV